MPRVPVIVSILVFCSLLTGLMAACSTTSVPTSAPNTSPAAAKAVVLRLAHPWPATDNNGIKLQEMADSFNSRTGGRYVIETHTSESLVKIGESMDAVRTAGVEIAAYPAGPFSSLDPRFATAELPFLYDTAAADGAAQVKLLPLYSEFMEQKFNQKAISSWTVLGLDITSTRPIKTAADWKGMLVQSISPQNARLIELMGGAPVAMPFPEGYQAIQKKLVDASMQATSMVINFKLYEVAKYETCGYIMPASLIVSVNLDAWNKMPKDIQDILVEEGLKIQQAANILMVEKGKSNIPILEQNGMEVYHLPKAERDAWKAILVPYTDSLLAEMGDFGTKVRSIAQEANTNNPYPY